MSSSPNSSSALLDPVQITFPARSAKPQPKLAATENASTTLRIVVVGGGSYNWSPVLLCDLLQAPTLEGSEIVLWDIDIAAAEDIKRTMDAVAAANGKSMRFTVASSEEEAFRGADFVMITISTGGLATMRHDVTIPEKYSIFQTVGDSVGPGGWSRLLRNVPVFMDMAEKIQRLAPDAVILNYTNPMAGLTGALSRSCSLRVVGLCHGMISTRHYLSRIFGTTMQEIQMLVGGINHFFWLLDFRVDGRDGYAELRKKLNGGSLLKFDKASRDPMGFSDYNHLVFAELYEDFGRLSYSGDRHTCEFFNRYLTNKETLERYKLKRTTMEDRELQIQEAKQRAHDLASGKEAMPERSAETAVDIIHAMTSNTPFVDVVNLPNVGQVDNLPRGAVVETLGVVNATGFSPIACGPLPAKIHHATEPHCHVQMMTLEAAMTGDRSLALDALMLDPLCAHLSSSDVKKMGLELLEATRSYLPQFE